MEITDRQSIDDIIRRCRVCRLGLSRDGQPYVVPLCFGYDGGAFYFHAAAEGKKTDILRENDRVCFELDIPGEVRPGDQACHWGMSFESVIGTGRAEIVEEPERKREALAWIMRQYSDGQWTFPDQMLDRTLLIRVKVEEIEGKAKS